MGLEMDQRPFPVVTLAAFGVAFFLFGVATGIKIATNPRLTGELSPCAQAALDEHQDHELQVDEEPS